MREGSGRTRQGQDHPARYVDTHCHLDDEGFAADIAGVVAASSATGVDRMIVVGFAPDRWASSIDLASRFPGISCMLGVHPGNTDEWSAATERDLRQLVDQVRPVAIGEIGMDFYRGETNLVEQRTSFERQLGIALDTGLPAVIHMRNAETEVLDVLRATNPLPPLLFHSFDGSAELTGWILDHDAWVGVGGLATRGKATDLRRQLARIPLDRMVLETDSPYLVPSGFKHRRNTPESIPVIAGHLAQIKDCPVEAVAAVTTSNAEHLFPGIVVDAAMEVMA
jgi:TatD DNase family protein